ncbi:cupin domain-containing protein [Opitutus terrae]|uniref:Cupin 2, conserved barrel n=1 Tax=Opitutus terrae (strain DSM 11246 / JCM 15787 / PB90-1) TaxID=452637 RepID=B1ZNM7_OPITP|nr:cupin domain-containing protein [Opitutus terrae]ACB74461.1 cupin 2, conserved barrel [Opitutus terrae PB90-1]
MADAPEVLTFTFADAGAIPNNPTLPVLVYKHAADPAGAREPEALARWFEDTWPKHGWRAAWRYGVYDFPHYHSTAHEVLGVYRGQASLRLGDKTGATLVVQAGDMIVLPAGTVHQNLGASSDFHVVGGYPEGQSADLLRGEPGERPAADERIAKVPRPKADPLSGASGALMTKWAVG